MILFLLTCLKLFCVFPSTVCVLSGFINGFIHDLFKVLDHIHTRYLEILVLCFYVTFLRATVVGLLVLVETYCPDCYCVSMLVSGFGLIVILGVDICSCLRSMGLLFLGFCFPLWILGECGGCGFCGKECF